jgi:hypothetical protein
MNYIGAMNYEVMNRILKTHGILNREICFGCEVGVREGRFSEFLILNNPNLIMHCVDPYTPYKDRSQFYNDNEQDNFKLEASVRLAKFPENAAQIFETSLDAAAKAKDGQYDFVYIDALHELKAVEDDMEAWITKVRSKGVLSGHDFSMVTVGPAVQKVAKKYGKALHTSPAGEGDSWWFQI